MCKYVMVKRMLPRYVQIISLYHFDLSEFDEVQMNIIAE